LVPNPVHDTVPPLHHWARGRPRLWTRAESPPAGRRFAVGKASDNATNSPAREFLCVGCYG